MEKCNDVSTKGLVEILSKREGVQEIDVRPYESILIKIKDHIQELEIDGGPCKILIIWD